MIIDESILETAGISETELRIEIALIFFEKNKLTFGQAQKLAGLNVVDFMKLLGSRKIALHYFEEDLEKDFKTASAF